MIFSELESVRATTRAFTGFSSVWWSVHCKKNIDNQPTTWKDLKYVMRQQFFPPYYRRELLRKFDQFKQGNNTVHAYYQEYTCDKSFTYMCKLSCDIFMPSTCDNFLALDFMNYESYSSIHVSYVQKSREVKNG